jgi:hypothetical protein
LEIRPIAQSVSRAPASTLSVPANQIVKLRREPCDIGTVIEPGYRFAVEIEGDDEFKRYL